MSLLNGLNKSDAQIRYERILEKAPKVFQGEKNRCLSAFNDLWGSENNPLPIEEVQAVLNLFGSDAYQLFQIHQVWQQFIKTVDPTYEPLVPPYEYTINPDGTVTLSEESSSGE
jgi:hypothetical protein